jgi:hypothetical protein
VQGSISFGFGFFLVLIGWPALGMMVESYGFIMLFRLVISLQLFLYNLTGFWFWHLQQIFLSAYGIENCALCLIHSEFPLSGFWPTAAVYLQKSPSFGWIFHHPFVTSVRNSLHIVQLNNLPAMPCFPGVPPR